MIKVGDVFWGRLVRFSHQGDILFTWRHCCSWFGSPGWCSVPVSSQWRHSFLSSLFLYPTVCSPRCKSGELRSLLLRRHLCKNYVKFFCMRDLSVLHLFTYSIIYLYHYGLILIILWVTILYYFYFLLRLLFDSFFVSSCSQLLYPLMYPLTFWTLQDGPNSFDVLLS